MLSEADMSIEKNLTFSKGKGAREREEERRREKKREEERRREKKREEGDRKSVV